VRNQKLTADVVEFSLWSSIGWDVERGPVYGNEIYIEGVVFDRVSRTREQTLAGQARESLVRTVHPKLAEGRLRFAGNRVYLCLHMIEGQLSGIGNPPKPAIGTLEYSAADEYDDEAALTATLYPNAASFENLRKTIVELSSTKLFETEIEVTVDRDLSSWTTQEPVLVTNFCIRVKVRSDA
jgi:hypothetical protein